MTSLSSRRRRLAALQRLIQGGLELLFPLQCAGCGHAGTIWCPVCDAGLQRPRPPICARCGEGRSTQHSCRTCQGWLAPLQARSFATYQGPIARALVALKYRPNRRLAEQMAGWLEGCYREAGWSASVVMPVPLGRRREKRRGYNQAEMLATRLAQRLDLPVNRRSLVRSQETRSQVGLLPAERRANVSHAFTVAGDRLEEHAVLLIDDLFTTGATLLACAEALHGAGAQQVLGLTVARA